MIHTDALQCKDFPLLYRQLYAVHRCLRQCGFVETEFTAIPKDGELFVVLNAQGRTLNFLVANLGDADPKEVIVTWLGFLKIMGQSTQPQLDAIWRRSPLSKGGHSAERLQGMDLVIKAIFKNWMFPPSTLGAFAPGEKEKLWGDGPPPGTPTEDTFSLIEILNGGRH